VLVAVDVNAMMALDESSFGDISSMQIVFLISDGRIERNSRATLRRLIRDSWKPIIFLLHCVRRYEQLTINSW
jgi:hypothetical protein